MDLSTYDFPKVTDVDLAFPTFDTKEELLAEARRRNPRKGMDKFDDLFFNGGKIVYQKDVRGSWKEKAFLYARALMGSFAPKHQDKRLVVGMIFEETLEL
jgi:hypothetical protein